MENQKMRPRIEQMQFGSEILDSIKDLIEALSDIKALDDISQAVEELNKTIEDVKEDLSEISDQIADKLGTLDMVPRLVVLEGTVTVINQEDIFIEIPSKAIELKTINFLNLSNTDNLKLIISEHNDFSTEDYSSLERQKIYDIANIPLVDQDNNENFKLKLRFINKSSSNITNVSYKIKLTNFSLKTDESNVLTEI